MRNRKPYPYIEEFKEKLTRDLKSRTRLFCIVSSVIYIAICLLSLILEPAEFKRIEIVTWVFLVSAAAITFFISQKTKSLLEAKIVALLFVLALLLSFSGVFLIYPQYIPAMGSAILALLLFFVSFVIPWGLIDIATIGLFYTAAYIFLYMWHNLSAARRQAIPFTQDTFIDGLIFLAVTMILCVIIRKRDNDSEKENFLLYKQLEARNKEMEKELALARDIHKTLIPQSTTTDKAAIAVNYVPISSVGGDYATFHVTKTGGLFFLIGDVTGHGVPAALLVNRIYGETENLIAEGYTPGALLKELDKFVQQHFKDTQMYFSVCSGLLDFEKKRLFYSNYGHPPQILHQKRDNRISLLESQTYLLGVNVETSDTNTKIFEGLLDFDNKDRIVLFTDGLIETKGKDKEDYGMERLKAFVKSHTSEHPSLFNSALLKEVSEFRVGPITDDIFLLTIDIK